MLKLKFRGGVDEIKPFGGVKSDRTNKYQKINTACPSDPFNLDMQLEQLLQVMLELARRGFALQARSRRMKV